MRNIVFVAPFPAEATLRFVRATKALGSVCLLGVVHHPPGEDLFDDVARVDDPMDLPQLYAAVKRLVARRGPIHRIIGILEPLQVHLAILRERLGVEGIDVHTAELFRDKARMKDALRAAGLPCARHRLLRDVADARSFVDEVGLPIVLKPPDGMGAKATWRISSLDQLKAALSAVRPTPTSPTLAEELVRGTEHSFDTITLEGDIQMASITDYFPTPLEVLENPWIQWVVVAPRRIDGPELDDVRSLGAAAVRALGLRTAMTHMEWFRRQDGSLAIGEIAARPPGANISRMMGLCHDTSMYRAWARAMVDNAFDGPWERCYAAGAAFLRGPGRGRVLGVSGIAQLQARIGEIVVEAKLPVIGAPKSDSYEGDGYLVVRHHDTDVVRRALADAIEGVRVTYA